MSSENYEANGYRHDLELASDTTYVFNNLQEVTAELNLTSANLT